MAGSDGSVGLGPLRLAARCPWSHPAMQRLEPCQSPGVITLHTPALQHYVLCAEPPRVCHGLSGTSLQ
ncbi:hypothetical protein FMEAI12_6260008 [Parafrankia sp. Ea1.12]|nr:hypothetical protein FMEAI12_6260008 [Parafrankia sp. Ea1.12]